LKKKLLLSILFIGLFNYIKAQDTHFVIKDSKDKLALPAVSFTLSQDTLFRKKVLSDQNGKVSIANLTSGKYRLQSSYVGYLSLDTTLQIQTGQNILLFLKEEAISLQGVTIAAKKKFIEMKKGNFILNVQESALAKTSNGWDALKYGPLVETGMDGTLKVENKAATVFIDGRQIFLSGEELMKYLENIPAANIEKVEISSHPGAKYDSSVGAVILITTTNLKYEGLKGTLNLSNAYGIFPRYNGGLTLDAKKGKFITQAGYTYGHSKLQGLTNINTSVNLKNLPWQVTQTNINNNQSQRVYGNLGLDLNKNNLLTIYAEYTPNTNNNEVDGNNGVITLERQLAQDSVWQSFNSINGRSRTFASQAIYESKWDSTKQSVKFTMAYSRNNAVSTVDNNLSYYDSSGGLVQKMPFYRVQLPGQTNFTTFSGQYVRPLWTGEWISGLKYYNTTLSNENSGYTYTNIERTAGEALNSKIDFRYNEFNYGAFTSWEAQIKSWYFQLGLRVEQNRVFSQVNGTDREKIYDRISPFPSLYIQKRVNAKNLVAINYSKQISRPDYSLLNPFSRFTNNTVANFVGNDQIKPARTHSLNLSWTYNNKLVFSSGVVMLNDLISSILLRNNDGLLFQQYDNFNGIYYYLGGYYTAQPTKFWQLSINTRLSTIDVKPYGNLPLGKANVNIYGNVSNDLSLPKNWKIGLGFDWSNFSSDKFYHHRGYSNLNAAITKEFKKPQLNLYIRANDILKDSYSGNNALFIPYNTEAYNDRRTVVFGLTYRFGKQTVKAKEITKDNNLEESNKRLK
jgi:hypothetical protein